MRFGVPSDPFAQAKRAEGVPGRDRRHSNEGYRKLSLQDRVLMFVMRMRRRVPFEGLRLFFGVSAGTAHNYFDEMRDMFWNDVMPRLLHPRSGAEIDAMTSAEIKADLPGAKIIFDLTAFPWNSKENVLLARVLYSAYHHRHEGGAVFGK